MSSAPLKTYDLDRVVLMVGTVRVTGFGETDVLAVEAAQDIGQMTETADGQAVFSRNNSRLMYAEITVMETSLAYKLLADLMTTQAGLAQVAPLIFSMLDQNSGDTLTSQYATFIQRPLQSKGKTAGERVFRISLPNAIHTYGSLLTA